MPSDQVTAPTPGIEPTIRRIAEDVCREYLGSILGLCLGKQKAPQEPAPVDESEAVRKAREEAMERVNAELAENWVELIELVTGQAFPPAENRVVAAAEALAQWRDAAVHQARVDALLLDTPRPLTDIVHTLADAATHLLRDHDCDKHGWELLDGSVRAARTWLDRLEREQAKTTGAKEGDEAGRHGDYLRDRDCVRSGDGMGDATAKTGPVTPAEAKGAPEQMPAEIWASGPGCMWSEQERALRGSVRFIRADVVERRVAETGSAARIQAALSTRHVLQAAVDEDTQDAARRVVAERDEHRRTSVDLFDTLKGEQHKLVEATERAEAAEARVWELEHDKACTEESLSALHRELSSRHAEKESAESELARVRAELADEQQKRRDSDRVSLEQLNMILTAREALELRRPK